MVLVLRDQRIFVLAVHDPLPQRPDQAEEPGGLDNGPAGGFEFFRGHVAHVRSFLIFGEVCGEVFCVSGHFING